MYRGALQQLERLVELAEVHAGPALGKQRARLEGDREARPRERLADGCVVLLLERGLGELDELELAADAGLEKRRIGAEPRREPKDRRSRGPRDPALDLAQILLREPRAGELFLCQAALEPELTHAIAERVARNYSLVRSCHWHSWLPSSEMGIGRAVTRSDA